ncbi:hypothetical protein DICVIV_02396 [Dictyocaulus viviparus]|uniref:EB domain-containing protein n=1 Tax=Dictyocaulus viviparus TaxID=29172 RepID=A0A0D8Y5B6_DICVI|nr:hypothetical protein DICVIV_02396 [Dictyocaulus viviparus]
MVEIDEPCETDQQCRGRSKCINTTCACRAGEDNVYGVCVKRMASRKTTTCPITGQTPLIDELTMRAKFCEPSKSICPHGYSCQFSETARRNICCGIGEDTSTTSSPLPETTENSISTLDPNIDTDAQTGKEITRLITTAPIHGVCEKGSPYLMNGRPKQCTDTPCPPNYKCRFSKARRNYYCCTTSNYNHGCPSGYPLLFPSTGTPVQCSYRRSTMCPAGYTCVRSITTKIFQCCSTNDSSTGRSTPINREISNKKNSTQAPCLNGQVLVLRIVDEHIVKKCEASCPPHQMAVRGVCRDRYQDDKPIMLNLMT